MLLHQVFRLGNPSKIAVVGSGGKTSTILRLAESLGRGVIITTTTHIGVKQAGLQSFHQVVLKAEELQHLIPRIQQGIVCVTGLRVDDSRVAAPSDDVLAGLRDLADANGFWLLIEADGSRMLPLKAPAVHEPVIPNWCDSVIVCVGCSGINQPLTEQVVHRVDQYSQLAGLEIGGQITPSHAANVINHPGGGLKNIPKGCKKILVLNQTEDVIQRAAAYQVGQLSKKNFDRVIISSMDVRHPEPRLFSRMEAAEGIILAAGGSTRLGRSKHLLDLRGIPLIRKVCQNALASGLDRVIVVTGNQAEEVEASISGLPVSIIRNPHWNDGQSTSICCGLTAVSSNCGAAMFLLGDQPFISPQLIDSILDHASTNPSLITAPLVNGQRGNPVLFDRDTFGDLKQLDGDQGGKALFKKYPVSWTTWLDERVLLDIDTMDDYERVLAEING